MNRATGCTIAIAALLAIGVCAPGADSVAAAPAAAAFDPKDLSGTWDRYTPPRGAAPAIPAPAAVPAPPLKPQFKAEYEADQKKRAAADAAGEPIATGYTHCLPDGMPAMMQAMFPMEILQSKGQITFIQEAYNQVRRVYLGYTLPAIDDAEPGFWGHATGKWEGNDFVTETIGIKDYVRYRNTPHSANMRIRERMRMIDANHFENEVTVEDPEYLTGPWKWKWVYQRRPDYKIYEYVCEDNREFADPETGKARLRIDTK